MANGADNLDQASEVEESFRQAAISYARSKNSPPKDFDGESCYDCGVPIPEGRLKLGKFTCVDCQQVREKQGKIYGR